MDFILGVFAIICAIVIIGMRESSSKFIAGIGLAIILIGKALH
jgi:hypothetical protein